MSRLLIACILAAAAISLHAEEQNWAQWRGPDHVGRNTAASDLPIRWSETDGYKWKVELESWSAATPIIWGDYVFVTSAEKGFNDPLKFEPNPPRPGPGARGKGSGRMNARPDSNDNDALFLFALNRADGSIRWKVPTGDKNKIYRKQNMASPSPVTDGKTVWVMTGVGTLTAFDFNGKLLWLREIAADYGEFGLNWGYASSPRLHEDRLYIQVLHGMTTDDPSYVLGVDASTGKTLWRTDRPTEAIHESPDNYATPILVPVDGKLQLVVSGGDIVTGHDIDTGEEQWRLLGFNPNNERAYRTIASSVAIGGMVFTTARSGRPFIGFNAGGSGDVTGKAELWTNNLGTDVPTPTTDGKRLYVVNDRGILTVLDPKSGETIGERKRLEPGAYSSSPLLADGKLYATNEDGATTVVDIENDYEILAVNKLDDYTLASPVAVGNQVFIRTMKRLYCFEK